MKLSAVILVLATVTAGAAFCSGDAEDASFDLSGIDSVTVDAGSMDVQVTAATGDGVSLRSELPRGLLFNSRGCHVVHHRTGSRLTIVVELDFPFGSFQGGTLFLLVPLYANLRVATSSGKVSLEGIEGDRCAVTTASGRVAVRDARSSLEIDSSSGDLSIDSFEGTVKLKTVSGRIKARHVLLTGSSSFNSVSGSIDMGLDMPLDDISFDLSSVSGRIVAGSIRAERGLRMGFGRVDVKAYTVSGSLMFQAE